MRRLIKLLTLGLLPFLFPLAVSAESAPTRRISWIETFDHKEIPRSIGTWEHNVLDSDQSISVELVDQDAANKIGGKALAIHFDVDSPNPAMVGCWIKFENQNLSAFDTLHLNLKSGGEGGFTGNIAVQFTDTENRKAPYLISGVGKEWKEYRIPLKKFRRIADWSEVKEFEIIIDDINASPKEGILLIDEIYVSSSKAGEASYR